MIIEPDVYRKYTRLPIDAYVNVEFISDRYDECVVKNLSLTGMFIRGDFQQLENYYCNINLSLSSKPEDSFLQGLGKVVRKDDDGMAIEFASMHLDSYLLLQATLLNQTDDPLLNNKLVTEECPFEVTDDFPASPISDFDFLN